MIAVPHNGNASNGLMLSTRDMSGKPITRDYAERRMANEPLAEIIQAKGQSDTEPGLSPNDEFANFELWKYKLDGSGIAKSATGSYSARHMVSGIDSTEPSNHAGSHGNQDNDPRKVVTATKSVVVSIT